MDRRANASDRRRASDRDQADRSAVDDRCMVGRPDEPGRLDRPMILWRAWRVRGDRLYAPIWNDVCPWTPGGAQAECKRNSAVAHMAPDPDCGCGWYGYYDLTAGILPHPDDRRLILDWRRGTGEHKALAAELGVSLGQLYLWHSHLCTRAYDADGQLVDGIALVWGRTEMHGDGARAECAVPWGLLTDGLHRSVAARVARAYGMVRSDDPARLLAAAREWGEQIGLDHPLRGHGRDFPGLFKSA